MKSQFHLKATPVAYKSQRVKLFIMGGKGLLLTISYMTFFTSCVCSEVQSTKVKMYMLDMMASLLQEGESISQAVLDTILINIVDPVKVRRGLVVLRYRTWV